MKLRELAAEHNLAIDLLLEVVGEDLKIRIPKGIDSELSESEAARILASDGLETEDGQPFTPIIAKEFEEKHKRSLAARKAATTRKRKLADEEEAKRRADEVRIGQERRKHGEELERRRREDEARAAAEAQAQAQQEALDLAAAEAQRRSAEEDLRRREDEAKRMAAEFAAMREARNQAAPAEPPPSPAPADAPPAPAAADAVAAPAAPAPASEEPPAAPQPPPVAAAPKPPAPQPIADGAVKAVKGIGSKLASMAKQVHEKADHSIKAAPKPAEPAAGAPAAPAAPAAELTAEDRRRLIQANIQRNLEMQKRVQAAKAAGKRPQGFRTIDRTKTPGGPARGPGGPARGPGGPARGPGGPPRGPAKSGGRGRDQRDTRTEAERAEQEGKAGRRFRSTLEEDISGVTEFQISLPTTVKEFSEASGVKVSIIIAKLFMAGVMANINSVLDKDAVELLALEFKKTVTFIEARDAETAVEEAEAIQDKDEDLAPRPPVVTIMGHVDHGKTSLLDAIRKTNLVKGEAGGITQHIGAYTVATKSGDEVTFIDTPGHQAFTEMRSRGAQITDVVVIVVDAVDGVMPQTAEAISHAKAANVAIVVAMNKIDKPEADQAAQERTIRQLAEAGLQAEEWGGEIAVVRTSALSGAGIDELLERLALETEMLELRANHGASASGVVIEARREEGAGVIATMLVRRGSLFVGDVVIAGVGYGRVRALTNWKGERVDIAGPSHAVEISGLDEMPTAGDKFQVMEDIKEAAEAAELRRQKLRERELAARQKLPSAATLFTDIAHSKKKELRVVVKADASGSLEVLRKTISELATDDLRVTIIHSAVGAINASDVTLAGASQAMVVGFHVIADGKARALADGNGVDIRSYTVIYELLDELRAALHGMLEPETRETVIGHANVLQTFTITKVGAVAGLRITDGIARRDALMRITRDNTIIHTGRVGSLRRFKEDVKEVKKDFECGLTVEGFQDIRVGDSFEFYIKEKVAARAS